ncbi:MAG: hypothetical protein AUG84_03110 [Chloroflexi bacterium 13_1_20CM_4_66_7]|nr:MAG: hypothetical protein AUG84_03110 [Chloroflexi bacterium 13_1_20CM_4_66_7]
MADLTRWERALDIQNGGGALTAMWARHFGFTHQLESTRARVASTPPQADARSANTAVARASPRALPYREAAFDCVMWEGAVSEGVPTARHPDASPALREAFAECRRVLRPDGCLYLGVAVAAWRGRPRGAGRILSGLTRIVVRLADTVLRGESQRRMSERAQRLDRLSLPRTLRRLLEQAGFSEVQSFYIDPS